MQRVVIRRQMSPRRKAVLAIFSILGVLGLMAVSFLAGHIYSGQIAKVTTNASFLSSENTRLSDQVKQLDSDILHFQDKVSVAENELHLQKLTTEEMKKLLDEETRKKMLLEKELGFYRKVSKKVPVSSFNLRALEFKDVDGSNSLSYRFTLAKTKKGDDKVSGRVKLLIKGKAGGKDMDVKIPGLGQVPMKYGFTVFQAFDGTVTLPEDFQPKTVSIDMVSASNGRTVFERTYDWQDVHIQ